LKGSPARELGSFEAPDAEMAHAKAVEVSRSGRSDRDKVMVVRAG